MIKDPTIYLIAQELQRISSLELSSHGEDYERYEFQSHLDSFARDEHPGNRLSIIRKYLLLDNDDLQELSPELHIWFLERICSKAAELESDVAVHLVKLYFLLDDSICRYYVVSALLGSAQVQGNWLSRWLKSNESSYTIGFEDDPASNLEELAELLLDIRSDESLRVLVQLRSYENSRREQYGSRTQRVIEAGLRYLTEAQAEILTPSEDFGESAGQ